MARVERSRPVTLTSFVAKRNTFAQFSCFAANEVSVCADRLYSCP